MVEKTEEEKEADKQDRKANILTKDMADHVTDLRERLIVAAIASGEKSPPDALALADSVILELGY